MPVRRRGLLAGSLGAVALSPLAYGQQPPRLAWIGAGTAAEWVPYLDAFRDGLRENGLVEGRDFILDLYWADGQYERFPTLVATAMTQRPAMFLAVTIASVRAIQQQTKTIPIVFMSTNDPVGAGLVQSLARPGGNATGIATMADDAVPKLVELVREALPNAKRLAALLNPLNSTNRPIFEQIRVASLAVGMTAMAVEVDQPSRALDAATAAIAQGAEAFLVGFDATHFQLRESISALGIAKHVGIIANHPDYARAGALLGYGAYRPAMYRRSATYVKRILAGAKPGDLPVEQPTSFGLMLNLRTAKAIGLTLPPSLLARADEVIE